jgi:hypothetical protein
MMFTAFFIASCFVCAQGQSEDADATVFFTDVLSDFSDVQTTGYPDLGYVAVDPFVTSTFSFSFLSLTFEFDAGTLTGCSSSTYTDVLAVTSDSENYKVTYTARTSSWSYLASYTITGEISGAAVTSTGAVIMTATSDTRDVTLYAVKSDDTYTMEEKQETDTLAGVTLQFAGIEASAQAFVTEYETSLIEVIRFNIMSQYEGAENNLLETDIANTTPSSDTRDGHMRDTASACADAVVQRLLSNRKN